MPVSTNPNATVPYWFECDAQIPMKDRPVFLVKFLTQIELELHAELMERALAEPDDARCAAALLEAMKVGLRGWKNIRTADGGDLPFTDQNLFDVLTDQERWRLAWQYPSVVRLTPVDLGHFASPAPSGGAQGAGTPPASPATSAPPTA